MSDWPEWAKLKAEALPRDEARKMLSQAQAFWRDFALAGLTIPELRAVIEERRRKGPGGSLSVPGRVEPLKPKTKRVSLPDNSLFEDFSLLNPYESRWIHA